MSERGNDSVSEVTKESEESTSDSTPDVVDPELARIAAGEPPAKGSRFDWLDVRLLILIGVLVALCVAGFISQPDTFFNGSNISTMLRLGAAIGVVSVGMTFVIISGGIDLSVGSMVALAAVWMTTTATQSFGPFVMVLCALAVGLGAGLVNGILIAYGKMVPFIATLAMFAAARGLAQRLSNEQTQTIKDPEYGDFFGSSPLGVPMLIWMMAIVFVVGWVVLNRTTFGRRTFAVGGNAEAARLAGINVKLHTMMVYGIAGLCCGIAAIMVVTRANSGSSNLAELYELDAIAAVVIGGTALSGGRGSLLGTLVGVLIFTVVNSIFIQNNLETDVQRIAKGAIIVLAVLLQYGTLRSRKT